MKLQIP